MQLASAPRHSDCESGQSVIRFTWTAFRNVRELSTVLGSGAWRVPSSGESLHFFEPCLRAAADRGARSR
jgi:hypothetical protein